MSPKTASNVLLVLVIGLAMITAPAFVLNSGYLLAKKGSANSNSNSGSGSGSTSSNSDGSTDNKDSGTSDKGSSDSGSGSGSGSNNNDNPTTTTTEQQQQQSTDKQIPEAQPQQNQEQQPVNPILPSINPNPSDKPKCLIPEGCGPTSPNPNPTNPIVGTPNFSCHFHPESPKCAPDSSGNCPGGFAKNDKGQCHPTGPCPPGFGRHDNDESGKCFRNPGNGIIHFPPFINHCGNGFGFDHGICVKRVFIDIINHHSSSSSSSSGGSSNSGDSSISNKCIAEIKIAWLGKVHRGENHEVDKIIDKCLGIH